MTDHVDVILTAWRNKFPNNAYAWPGAPGSFAEEAARSIDSAFEERIDHLIKALKHAQEALFWYRAEGFELDGQPVGIVVERALALGTSPISLEQEKSHG